MKKQAAAYISDIMLGKTGEVITRQYQKEQILRHAALNDIEIVAWFEDEMFGMTPLEREGVRALLASVASCDLVLVERVWTFGRHWPTLKTLFDKMETAGAGLECAAEMWDCISQMARRRFDKSIPGPKHSAVEVRAERTAPAAAKPRRAVSAGMFKAPCPA